MDNAGIADRLDAFASLLELSDANPYTARAYRRAAEMIRAAAVPVADLVRAGRVRELRGIGPGIEARLRELVETGAIAELEELERTLSPELIGLGRYLGLSARRAIEIAQALDVHTADELRAAAAEGRLRDVPGIGPKIEAQIVASLTREPEPRVLLLSQATELVTGIAAALDGEVAGDVRRWRDTCEHLAVVCAPAALARFAGLPQIVAVIEQDERRAVGVTVEGVPVEAVAAEPGRRGTALLRATGAAAYVDALEPLPDAPDEPSLYARLGIPFCPPELREAPFAGEPPPLLALADIRGDLHCHTTWSDGRASVEEMGRAARDRGYDYIAICDHTPAVGAVQGLTADDVRRQGEEIAAANAVLAPFRVLRGIECDILPDGRLDLPDDVLAELDWVQASVHGGQRMPARRDDQARRSGAAQPARQLPQPSHGPAHHPPPGERARPRPHLHGRARDRRRARGQRAGAAPRPQRGARPRGAPRGRADRLLDRCALHRRAREHAAVRPYGTARVGDRRRRRQHPRVAYVLISSAPHRGPDIRLGTLARGPHDHLRHRLRVREHRQVAGLDPRDLGVRPARHERLLGLRDHEVPGADHRERADRLPRRRA